MATLTVTTLDDEAFDNDGSDATDGNGLSLREAIGLATTGDTITFTGGLDGGTLTLGQVTAGNTSTVGSGELTIATSIIIDGDLDDDDASDITIDANASSRVFNITSGTSTLDGLTITGGNAVSSGGGIFLGNGASLTVQNGSVSGNAATNTGSVAYNTIAARGGGIYAESNTNLYIDNTTITGNSVAAINNGPYYSYARAEGAGLATMGASLTITDSTITNNTLSATSGSGYAYAYFGGVSSRNADVTITGSTFSGNDSSGLQIQTTDTISISNSIFSSNAGVGISASVNPTGTITVDNIQVADNGSTGASFGVSSSNSTPTVSISNSSFVGNGYRGLSINSQNTTVTNVTAANNQADGIVVSTFAIPNSSLVNVTSTGNQQDQIQIGNLGNVVPGTLTVTDSIFAATGGGEAVRIVGNNGNPAINFTGTNIANSNFVLAYGASTTGSLTIETDLTNIFANTATVNGIVGGALTTAGILQVATQAAGVTAGAAASNNAPVITLPAVPVVAEDAVDVAITDDIAIADSDGDDQTVTLTITGGTASVGTTGLSFTTGDGTDDASLVFSGTTAAINTALDALTFSPTADLNGTNAGSLQIQTSDGNGGNDDETVTFDITAVNDAPTISGLVSDAAVTEDTASDLDLSAVSFADVDSAGSVTVTLTASAGTMAATTGGSVTVGGSGTGTLTLTGTFADINTFLDTASNIQYTGASNVSGDDAATVAVTANDDDGSGDVTLGTVNLDIAGVNNAPSLSGLTSTLSVNEGATVLIDNSVTFADSESNFNVGSLTVSGLVTGDVVSVQNTGDSAGEIGFATGTGAVTYEGVQIGTLTGGAGTTATITFNANATSPAVDALLESLTFSPTADAHTADRTLTIDVTDADGGTLSSNTSFEVVTGSSNPLNGVDIGDYSIPTFVDIDNDGDLDAFIGEDDGVINFYRNDGTTSSPAFTEVTGSSNPFDGVDVGDFSAPTFVDIDNDGDLDAFVGDGGDSITYLQNTGTASAPGFSVVTGSGDPLDGITVANSSAVLSFVDIDNDGDQDLFIGEFDGSINFLKNTGTASNPVFSLQAGTDNPFNGVDIGDDAKPIFIDIDNDGDLDAFVGEATNNVTNFFRNDGTNTTPVFTEVTGSNNPLNGFNLGTFSAPAFVDINNDGHQDAFFGQFGGSVTFAQGAASDTITVDVTVTGVNDAPTISGLATDVTVTEDTASDLDLSASVFADVDSAGSGIVTLTASAGTMAATTGGSVTVGGSGTDTLTLTGTFIDINAFLDTASNIQYTGASNVSGDDAATVAVTANDDDGSGDVALGTVNLDVTGVNDAATFGGDLTGSLGEDSNSTTGGTATATDVDTDDDGFTAGTVNGTYGNLTIDAGGVWTYDLEETLAGVQGLSAGDTLQDTIEVTSDDGTTQDIIVTINGADDAATFGGDLTGLLGEDSDSVGGTATATDVDSDDDGFTAGTVSGTYGDLTMAANGGWTYDLDETLAGVQALNAGDTLQDIIEVTSDDGTTQDITITINGANDAPTASDNTVTMDEDTSRTLTAANFNFADVDTANALVSVRIDTVTVGSGTFRLSGADVTAGDVIAVADITAGNLVYKPAGNANGNGLLTFTFSVNDGTDFAATPSTFTVNVTNTPDNSAPTSIALSNLSVDEDSDGASVGTVSATDPEGGAVTFSVDDNRFEIVGDTLKLKAGESLDFETETTVQISVRASDAQGTSGNRSFTVQVTDIAEPVNETGGSGSDILDGGGGDDSLNGAGGDDALTSGDGRDTIDGGTGNDDIDGGSDDDLLFGGTGNDTVDGGSGEDTLRGGSGNDLVESGAGNDLVYAGFDDDGDDTVGGDAGNDTLGGGVGNDSIGGGDGEDLLWGRTGDDNLTGGNGDDLIFNGEGNDTVDGGSGNDTLWAGGGNDQLSGGDGADTFVFGNTSGDDTITDFDAGEDLLNLEFAGMDFTSLAEVTAAATATTQAGQAGVLIDLGDSDSVFIIGINIADLTVSNVSF